MGLQTRARNSLLFGQHAQKFLELRQRIMVRACLSENVLNIHETPFKSLLQAATFKSIKSVIPLFDRILVQRFKPDTVSIRHSVRLLGSHSC
jgi:hypothetical protein